MSSEYGQRSPEELRSLMRQAQREAESAVPCFAVTEQNWKGLITLEQTHSELLLKLIQRSSALLTADEMNNLITWQTDQLSSLTTQTATLTEAYQKKLTTEAESFMNAAKTAVSDLSAQAGSVSASFSSALQNERAEMKRFQRRTFWISLLPTVITLASMLAWALWLR